VEYLYRLFSETCGPLDSYRKMFRFIRSTPTQTGLSVSAYLDHHNYPTVGRPGNWMDSGLGESDEGDIPCPQETNTILGPRREPGGRLSVLDMDDRLGVKVPYRACWRQL